MNTFDYVVIGVTMKSKGTPKSKDHATLFHTPTPRTWPVVPVQQTYPVKRHCRFSYRHSLGVWIAAMLCDVQTERGCCPSKSARR